MMVSVFLPLEASLKIEITVPKVLTFSTRQSK
jgi:hypothetical protein